MLKKNSVDFCQYLGAMSGQGGPSVMKSSPSGARPLPSEAFRRAAEAFGRFRLSGIYCRLLIANNKVLIVDLIRISCRCKKGFSKPRKI